MDRFTDYEQSHCWQYNMRLENLEKDMQDASLTLDEVESLNVNDFEFKVIDPSNEIEKKRITEFIKRHEWLGTISIYTTHWFASYYKGHLAGVILMGLPNSFSKLMGDNTKDIERLISRGACISWSPKNLASNLLMKSIKWMAKNTQYRLFSCYSDVEAKELGSIYQACNFYYIGQKSGSTKKYINPYNGKWVSDRVFRARSFYKKYAKELNIEWCKNWNRDSKMLWENIPDDIEEQLREMSKVKQREAKFRLIPPKHKYVYVLGADKRETKLLRREFENRNGKLLCPYPKNRGE